VKRRTFIPFVCLAIWLGACPDLTASLRVDIPWEKDWPVVTPAAAKDFGFVLTNTGDTAIEVEFSAKFTAPSGGEETIRERVALPPGGEKKLAWPLDGRPMGAWVVEYAAQGEGLPGRGVKRKIHFGYLDPAGPNDTTPEFLLGICAHSQRVSSRERQKEIAAAGFIGCKIMRNGVGWERIQPDSAAEWKWDVIDEIVDATENQKMRLQVLLAYTTRWAAPKASQLSANWLDWNRAMPDLAAWRMFVRAYAERFKGRIRLWEVWNEPDLEGFWKGTTGEYLELFKTAREELKAVDPENQVMNGGFATLYDHPSRKKNPDLQERVVKELGAQMDFHAIHEHGSFERFAQVVDGPYADLRSALGTPPPPILFNEVAEHSLHGTEKAQAETLVKKATFARARGGVGYFWYDLRNDGVDPGNPEHHFGLLTRDMEPKPAYMAFNTLARYMPPRSYRMQLDAGKNRWFFLFDSTDDKLLIFWNEDRASQNEQVLLRLPGATEVSLIDIDGNAEPLAVHGDLVVVNSSKTPQYLLARGATTIELVSRLAGPSRAFFGAPGSEVTVECVFYNPSRTPVPIRTAWEIPSVMTIVRPAAPELTAPPEGSVTSAITVKLPDDENYRFGRDGKLRISYDFQGLPYEGRVLIPVHYGTIVVPPDTEGRPPDIVLDRQEQLLSFIEADPHMIPHRWKGARDLSAKIWFAVDRDELRLRIRVTDNKHFQNESAVAMWKGDSVQCMLALPGQDGTWELGFAEDNAGKPLTANWARPPGMKECRILLDVERQGEERIYTARLSRRELGLTDQMLREGFRLNIAVNDNDGVVRAHALQIVPGIVANKSTDSAPFVIMNPPAP